MNSTPYNVRFNTNRYDGYVHPDGEARSYMGTVVIFTDQSGGGTVTAVEAGYGGVKYRVDTGDDIKIWVNRTDFYPAS